jgi:putative effector of murein hydrolase
MKYRTPKSYSDKMWLIAKVLFISTIILAFVLWHLLHHYTDHIWACRQSFGIVAAAAAAFLIGRTSKKIFVFVRKVIHAMRAINKLQNQSK